jgi:NADPH:quinone reductase-like Zn-dependent oxidoreductase
VKAVVFDQPGPPAEVLHLRDVPKPAPLRGEVLVRMTASPVNPSDLLYIEGRYGLKPALPATPGFEGVGVVESSGGGLLGRFLVGRRVVVMGSRTGNWAEYAAGAARQCIPVPDDLPIEQAATFFVNPATALAITRHVLKVPRGEWLLQTAAGSALGRMVIRLGKLHGFRTLNVVRRREQAEELKQLGADQVLVESDGPLPEQVRRVAPDGVRYAMDPVGGAVGTQVVQSLGDGGRAVLYGLLSGEPITVDPRFLITGAKRIEGFWLGDWAKRRPLLKKLRLIRQIRHLMRAGVLATDIGTTYPLGQVREAVTQAATPGKNGKVLLAIDATR